jgi:MFS family permease
MIGFGLSVPLFGLLFGSSTNEFYIGNLVDPMNLGIVFGFFMAVYGFGQFIANPILGALSDNIGRKPVLTFAILGTFLSRVVFLFGLLKGSLPVMFFSRFLDGATGGIISLANASVTDTTEPSERSKYIGKIMAGFSLGGFVCGPLIFTLFSYTGDFWSVVGPFVLAAFMSFVALFITIFFFPETLPKEKIHSIPSLSFFWEKLLHSLDNLKTVSKEKSARPFFIASGVFYLAFTAYTTFASQYLFSEYGLDANKTGIYFLVIGLTMTVMQGYVAHKIVKKVNMEKEVLPLSILLSVSMLIFTFAFLTEYPLEIIFANAFLFSMFVALNMVFMQSEISKIKTEHRGALMGAFSSIQVLALSVSPVLAGMLSKFSAQLPFVVGAFLVTVSGLLLRKAVKSF